MSSFDARSVGNDTAAAMNAFRLAFSATSPADPAALAAATEYATSLFATYAAARDVARAVGSCACGGSGRLLYALACGRSSARWLRYHVFSSFFARRGLLADECRRWITFRVLQELWQAARARARALWWPCLRGYSVASL